MSPITIVARDGMRLYGYLTLPVGIRPHRLPTVLKVHGGLWDRDRWVLDPESSGWPTAGTPSFS